MAVLLHSSVRAPKDYDRWAAITGTSATGYSPERQVHSLGAILEEAFSAIAPEWLDLGRELGASPSAYLAHAPSCATNVSDLGLMMAWSHLVDRWAHEEAITLVVCDDPWMFRHLQGRAGVSAGMAPGLLGPIVKLALRGYAARGKAALRLFRAAMSLRFQRQMATNGDAVLLVYGHPKSTPEGEDGYFGDLMQRLPRLKRMLHVDCPKDRALELGRDGRSLSLHGFGCPGGALLLPFAKWRPLAAHKLGRYGWLGRRAAVTEGGSGQGAMLAWQAHCQRKWLKRARPSVVAWPWENHSWERAFIRHARSLGVRTVGYQHSVVGRLMLNYSSRSNPDREASLPDFILASGPATRDRLESMDMPKARLAVGGALRFPTTHPAAYDPKGPVFVALPFDRSISEQMVEACQKVKGWRFLIKDHPMSPFAFREDDHLRRTEKSFAEHEGLATVLFAATTVGLEALLAGLPTLRFQPSDRIAVNILPDGIKAQAVSSDTLQDALENPFKPGIVPPESIFAPVALDLWGELLTPHD